MRNMGFWKKLKKPFWCLAPMDDVTDAPFRRMIARYGKPDVMYTAFVSCDGLCSPGYERLKNILMFDDSERPIVAQIFGKNPETFQRASQMIAGMGFDGIDINMGCPQKVICDQGAGAELINDPVLAKELILAATEGAGGLPVSVKTRIGYNQAGLEKWIPILLSTSIAALAVHGRTKKDMSKVPANWEAIGKVAEMARGSGILVIGNGDAVSLQDGREKAANYGVDGVMFGRAVFGNPWLFNEAVDHALVPLPVKLNALVEHCRLFEHLLGGDKRFAIMRKHFGAYLKNCENTKGLKMALMECENAEQVEKVVKEFTIS
jgi:nifR3 family TIM-barrel protein